MAGSIVLAGVILKLGGIGMIRVRPLVKRADSRSVIIPGYALFLSGVLAFLCLAQLDIKILIAFSSVCHMALAIAGFLRQTGLGALGAYAILLAHGIASSGLFMGANTIYLRRHTRRIIFRRGIMRFLPGFVGFWFILIVANLGGPPSLNLLREIITLRRLLNFN